MSDASILKEYLVALGFKVDDVQFKKFNDGLAQVEKGVKQFGLAVAGMATAVAVAVGEVSSQFEGLYYASQRMRDGVADINAFTFAISEVGGTSQGARSALEGLNSFMLKFGPGAQALLGSMGISATDASGRLRGTAEIMLDLEKRFQAMASAGPGSMGYALAERYASMLGIDEPTFQAMLRDTGQFEKAYKDTLKRLGVDQDAQAEKSRNFMQQWRVLQVQFGAVFQKVVLDIADKAMPMLQRFERWFETNEPRIVSTLERWTAEAVSLGERLFGFAERAIAWFDRLNKATDGWAGRLLLLSLAVKTLGLDKIAAGLFLIVRGLPGLIEGFAGAAEGAGALGAALSGPIGWAVALGAALLALLLQSRQFRDQLTAVLGQGWGAIQKAFSDLYQAIKPLADLLAPLGRILVSSIGRTVTYGIAQGIKALSAEVEVLADEIRLIEDLLRGNWSGAWADMKRAAQDQLSALAASARMIAAPVLAQFQGAGGLPGQLAGGSGKPTAQGQGAPGAPPGPEVAPSAGLPVAQPTFGPWGIAGDPDSGPRGLIRAMHDLQATIQSLVDWLNSPADPVAVTGGGGEAGAAGIGASIAGGVSKAGAAIMEPVKAFFLQHGFTPAAASGIAAGVAAEGGGVNTKDPLSSAYGIGQWLTARQRDFTKLFGHDIHQSNLGEQLQFMLWELTHSESNAGRAIAGAGSAQDALLSYIRDYMRPGPGTAGDLARGGRYLESMANAARLTSGSRLGADRGNHIVHHNDNSKSVEIKAPITMNVSGDSPRDTARESSNAIQRTFGDLLRNSKGAVA